MKNDIILSIILPTYNRAHVLKNTLSLFRDQVSRHLNDVELFIGDNASTDETKSVLESLKEEDSWFSAIFYEEHVGSGMLNLLRTMSYASGKFYLFWGDDDIPSPMMLDVIVNTLKKYPEIGTLSFNRINASTNEMDSVSLKHMKVFNTEFKQYVRYYQSSQEYAENHFSEIDFMSVNVVARDAWEKGMCVYTDNHLGFEFIAPILYGIQGRSCVYIEYPICIKRTPPAAEVTYAVNWPLYAYVGKPRILRDLEALGVVRNASEIFYKDVYNNRDEYITTMFLFCYPNRDIYLPFIDEMISYQTDKVRIFMTKAIRWPMFFKKVLKRMYRIAHRLRIV